MHSICIRHSTNFPENIITILSRCRNAARKAYESAGIKLSHFWMVTGQYDMIAILEAPDDVAVAKAILTSTSQGSFTTETCRAFTEDEYRKIIGGLP